ncbi:MAG: glycosyltransferase [Bradyrhizobiaceae bacterium]|nr:MAG: glycosyltransferase [Bradyrhizobiaceae bacterium]
MTNTGSPAISVIMPSYNHMRFIGDAIKSVLNQSFTDIELIVVDDGSHDGSADVIRQISDSRFRYRILNQNVGACAAMNIALDMTRGRYIAVCNSDDEWHPEKLSKQYPLLTDNPKLGAIFSDVKWIGDNGLPLRTEQLPFFKFVFQQKNRSRLSWIRDLLEGGNCLCHPSILIRKEVYERVGNYDNRFRQLPDLDMWIRLLQQYDIFVMHEALVAFRLHEDNTSAPNASSSRRSINEHQIILKKTLADISQESFIGAFGVRQISIESELDFEIEKALYMLEYRGLYESMYRLLGLNALYELMGDANAEQKLSSEYSFDIARFHKEMAYHSPWIHPVHAETSTNAGRPVELVPTGELANVLLSRVKNKIRKINSRW